MSFEQKAQDSLLLQIANGQKSAVAECVDRYGGLVWSLAQRLTPTRSDAEDAVQEVFISLWKSASRFDPGKASEPTFVAMVARRRLIDFQRRHKKFSVERDVPQQVDREPEAARPSPSDALATCEEAAQAAQLLRELPEDQSQAIRMSVYDGLSHSQIAESMGLPLGTVKTHIRRGLGKLRDRLSTITESGGAR